MSKVRWEAAKGSGLQKSTKVREASQTVARSSHYSKIQPKCKSCGTPYWGAKAKLTLGMPVQDVTVGKNYSRTVQFLHMAFKIGLINNTTSKTMTTTVSSHNAHAGTSTRSYTEFADMISIFRRLALVVYTRSVESRWENRVSAPSMCASRHRTL